MVGNGTFLLFGFSGFGFFRFGRHEKCSLIFKPKLIDFWWFIHRIVFFFFLCQKVYDELIWTIESPIFKFKTFKP
jgi:hypothetical protein